MTLVPMARLRWRECAGVPWLNDDCEMVPTRTHVLEQWHAPDVPEYMRGDEGEWRAIPVVPE